MASASKTPNLSLNNWNASDKPKREDFNGDNLIIDEVVGNHVGNDDIHVTADEKELWNASFIVGQYFGSGASSRTINIGFKPKFAIIFSISRPLMMYNSSTTKNHIYSAFVSPGYNSLGISSADNGFSVTQSDAATYSNCCPNLNESSYTYCYIAFK